MATTRPTQSEVESSLGVMPLEEIEAALDATLEEWANLAALYGPGGTYDDERKIQLSVSRDRVRKLAFEAATKLTEGNIDELGHIEPAYVDWVRGATAARARYLKLDKRREGLIARRVRGDALLRVAGRGI